MARRMKRARRHRFVACQKRRAQHKKARLQEALFDYMYRMSMMSPYLPSAIRDCESSSARVASSGGDLGLECGVSAVQGWRSGQEDAHVVAPDFYAERGERLALFAVFDGHGGGEVSRYCALNFGAFLKASPGFRRGAYGEALYETFFALDRSMAWPSDGASAVAALRAAHRSETNAANRRHLGAEVARPLPDEGPCADRDDRPGYASGCTATVVVVDRARRVAFCANAGDSRSLLCRAGREALALSEDHKPEDDRERARVEAAGGVVTNEGRVDGNLNLSRALGDLKYKTDAALHARDQKISCEPDVVVAPLADTDEGLILICDGVTGSLDDDAVVSRVDLATKTGPGDLEAACEDLVLACVADAIEGDGTGTDNCTALCVKFTKDGDGAQRRRGAKHDAPKPPRRLAFTDRRELEE